MKKTVLSALVVSALTGCGGGGSAQPTSSVPPTSKSWALTKISNAGSIQSDATGCGTYDIITKGDLNNDGHDDIVIGPKTRYDPATGCADSGFNKLIIGYYDPATKTFKTNSATQAVIPGMQWSSSAVVGDFNKDGYADLFAVGTGTDYGQPCGEAPILLLGSSNGFINASNLLPRFSSYSHQAAWADFNGDGKTDFVILNNDWVPTNASDPRSAQCSYRQFPGSNESYIILSSGNSWTYSSLRVSNKSGSVIINGTQSFNSVVAGDINNDGKADLVAVGSNWGSLAQQTLTLIGDGTGRFVAESSFTETPFGTNTVGANVSLQQLDSSGPLELLINYAEHPGAPSQPFQKSVYRIFSYNMANSSWTNVTDQYLTNRPTSETDLTYCARFYWVDLNSDSKDDFVCATINPFKFDDPNAISPRMWVRTANNKFEPAYHSGFSIINSMASPTPVKVDGKIKIVGFKNNNYRASIQLELAE